MMDGTRDGQTWYGQTTYASIRLAWRSYAASQSVTTCRAARKCRSYARLVAKNKIKTAPTGTVFFCT